MASTTPSTGIATSFTNTPQAADDLFIANNLSSTNLGGIVSLDVMANDGAGKAKSLYSTVRLNGFNEPPALTAEIRFTAFRYRTTRPVEGKLLYVAGDRSVDRNNGQPYCVALIETDAASLAEAEGIKLQAGMPAEVYIRGEERTPLQYLVEPITQMLRRAGRER